MAKEMKLSALLCKWLRYEPSLAEGRHGKEAKKSIK